MTQPAMTEREQRMICEQGFHDNAIAVPEGYSRVGVAWTQTGPRLYVTGPELPALYWGPEGWVRIVEALDA